MQFGISQLMSCSTPTMHTRPRMNFMQMSQLVDARTHTCTSTVYICVYTTYVEYARMPCVENRKRSGNFYNFGSGRRATAILRSVKVMG